MKLTAQRNIFLFSIKCTSERNWDWSHLFLNLFTYTLGLLLRCKNSSFESLNRQLFAIVVSQQIVNFQNMGASVYIWRCLIFGVNMKLKNTWGYARGFFSMRTVFVACTLQLVRLPLPFQSLDPCLLKIQDARLFTQ